MRLPDAITIDRSHPLAQGLAFLSLFNERAGKPIDVVSLRRPDIFGAAWVYDGIYHTKDDDCAEWENYSPIVTLDEEGTGDFTIFAMSNPAASTIVGHLATQRSTGADGIWLRSNSSYNSNTTATSGRVSMSVYSGGYSGVNLSGAVDGTMKLFAGRRLGTTMSLFAGDARSDATVSGGKTTLASGQSFCAGSSPSSTTQIFNGTLQFFGGYNRALSDAEIAVLADRTDPMIEGLIVEVRPVLYFDLGSAAPSVEGPAAITAASTISASGSKQAEGPATVTASASLGMGGVKGAVAPLNIVGALSIGTSGSKSTSIPATIAATAEYGASGIKTIAGLDKEGPAVITASATVGMGGVKGGVGAAVMGADSALVAGGAKGATGQAWFAAVGEFYAVRGPDELPITANEVARLVVAQGRTKTVIAQARTKTVIAKCRQRSVRYEIA